MVRWIARHDWMEFPRLSVNTGLDRTFTLAYKLTDKPAEKWSERFGRFKAAERKATVGAARLFYDAFPQMFRSLGLPPRDCVFVSVLSSSETQADPKRAIPFIARELAELVDAREAIAAITKQRHAKIHLQPAHGRDAELAKAQYVSGQLPGRNVFIFDDFVTRGSTLSKVAQAVHAANPGSTVFGVALAKNERISYCYTNENDHVPVRWNKIWTDGEKEV